MKYLKIFFVLILILGMNTIFAQTSFNISNKTTGDTLLTIDNDGRVGIGTTTPEASIDIKSSTVETASNFRLGNLENSRYFGIYSGNATYSPLISWHEGAALRFAAWTDTYNELMRITADGNVGIGTTDPTAKLDVRGSNTDEGGVFRLSNSDRTHELVLFGGRENDPNPFIKWNSGDPLRFSTDEGGWSEKMRITSDGKIGIGTTEPTEMLEVADTIYSTVGGFKFPDGSVQSTAAGSGSGNTLDQAYDQGGAGAGRVITADAGSVGIAGSGGIWVSGHISGLGGQTLSGIGEEGGQLNLLDGDGEGSWMMDNFGATDNEALRFFRGSGYNDILNALVINELGNVGIGTGGPSEKLTVTGTIHSNSGGFRFPDNSLQVTAAGAGLGNTLDQAYDQGGAGLGRTIVADNGAVTVAGIDGFLSTGTYNSGAIPVEGAGTRMMWYPGRRAFRAGHVIGTQWDDAQIGTASIAFGTNTIASGSNSTAMGYGTTASYTYSTAMGNYTTASGYSSTAMGHHTIASGNYSTGMGSYTTASGLYSTAMGQEIEAEGSHTVAIALSDQNGLQVTQDNTMAIMGGNVGIGTIAPGMGLEVADTIYSSDGGFKFPDGSVQESAFISYSLDQAYDQGGSGDGRRIIADAGAFEVFGFDGILSTGLDGYGTIPVEGSGVRMMWYPRKEAFRAGYVNGTQWNDVNIGRYSIALGYNTEANNLYSTAIGQSTTASGEASTSMGRDTDASGDYSTATGYNTIASGNTSTAIGYNTEASGTYSTAMGNNTVASGIYSTAMGNYVQTSAWGSFVIGDRSTTSTPSFSGDNTFIARFENGYRLFTNSSLATGVTLGANGASWSSISDSTKKENFKAINGEDFLNKISQFNLTSWNYIGQDPAQFRHYGPMAQDFYAAFGNDGVGVIGNDTTLASADFDGINFIAVQALEKRTTELKSENELLKNEVDLLKSKMERLESLLQKVEDLSAITRQENQNKFANSK